MKNYFVLFIGSLYNGLLFFNEFFEDGLMKKLNLLILSVFFASCGKQTAPPMDIQNTEKTTIDNQVDRVDMPEATFSAIPEPTDEIDRGPSPTPEPETETDVKDELKIEPILYEDFAWEKNMVEPGDYLIKIAKREYGDFRLWLHIYAWNNY